MPAAIFPARMEPMLEISHSGYKHNVNYEKAKFIAEAKLTELNPIILVMENIGTPNATRDFANNRASA